MNQVKIFNSISDVEKECWDALTENNIFMCYGWLKTFEETTNDLPLPYYITIFDENKIIAASVCYFDKKNEYTRSIDNVLLGRFKDFKLIKNASFLPAVPGLRKKSGAWPVCRPCCRKRRSPVWLSLRCTSRRRSTARPVAVWPRKNPVHMMSRNVSSFRKTTSMKNLLPVKACRPW